MFGYGGRIFALVPAIMCMFLVAGCEFNDLVPDRTEWDAPAPKDPVLVMYTIDVGEDARWPGGIRIERLSPEPGEVIKKSWRYKFKDQDKYVIMSEVLSVGTYRFNELYLDVGAGTLVLDVKDDPRFQRTFSRPGVYFLGAYKFRTILPPNRIGRMRFALDTVPGPGEREAIERLLTAKEAKNDYWREQLTKRLQQLGKPGRAGKG